MLLCCFVKGLIKIKDNNLGQLWWVLEIMKNILSKQETKCFVMYKNVFSHLIQSLYPGYYNEECLPLVAKATLAFSPLFHILI